MMTRWPSPAKLNLFLYITGQRADGYHELQTLFQFLDYGDTLTIEPRQDGQLRLLTPLKDVPDEDNLIIRAARLTGTGACVFAEFDTELAARQVLEQAPEWFNGFVAKGVNLSPLHQSML